MLRFVFPVPVSLSSSSCNILMRELVTAGQLKRVPRTENNPHGLLIVNWRTLLNKDIEQKSKSNY